MGGKGGNVYSGGNGGNKNPWVVCKNPKCKPYSNPNQKCWRFESHGPDACKFCDTPFRVPMRAGGGGGGNGGWKKHNSKGRVRDYYEPEVLEDAKKAGNGKGFSNAKPTGKPPKEDEDEDDVSRAKLLERFKDDPTKLQQIHDMFPEKPKKPKTESECLKEAMAAAEKAQSWAQHLSHVCSQMQTSYLKQSEDLLEYKGRLLAHQAQRDEAAVACKLAKSQLAEIKAKQASAEGPFMAVGDPNAIVASYNPNEGVAFGMAEIEGFNQVPPDLAEKLQRGMQELFKEHLGHFAKKLLVTPSAPAAAAVKDPANAVAADAINHIVYNTAGADGSSDLSDPTIHFGSLDTNMSSTLGKRGRAEKNDLDDDEAELFDGYDEFDGQQGVSEGSGKGRSQSQPSQPSADPAKTIADAEAAATAAVVGKDVVMASNALGMSGKGAQGL